MQIHQQALLIKGYLRLQIFVYSALFALPAISQYRAINLRRAISIWCHIHEHITQPSLTLRLYMALYSFEADIIIPNIYHFSLPNAITR